MTGLHDQARRTGEVRERQCHGGCEDREHGWHEFIRSNMVERLLAQNIHAVHILSRYEAKQDAMRLRFCDSRLKLFLGDVRDPSSVDQPLTRADHLFHATGLEQVPSCDFFPHPEGGEATWAQVAGVLTLAGIFPLASGEAGAAIASPAGALVTFLMLSAVVLSLQSTGRSLRALFDRDYA